MNRLNRSGTLLALLLCPMTGTTGIQTADSSIPGILQHAMKHQEEGGTAEQDATPLATQSANELKQRLQQQGQEMDRLRQENQQLRSRISAPDFLGRTAEITALQQRAEEAESVASALKVSVTDLTAQLAQMPVMTPEALNIPATRQSYAAGVMTGRDIQNTQLPGLKTDNRALLAGIGDALNQKVLLNSDALQAALEGAQAEAQQVVQNTLAEQKKAGDVYLAAFRRLKKDVHQDKSGFWYRVDYAGDGPLISADDSSVEVVVTEKLADGTVVEDMDANGRSLTMALADFPPLFRSALMLMKNHGVMTLVAPPQLAYGDAGYPPKVPPGATMVYTLRVDNVTLAPEVVLPDVKKVNAADSGKPARSEQK